MLRLRLKHRICNDQCEVPHIKALRFQVKPFASLIPGLFLHYLNKTLEKQLHLIKLQRCFYVYYRCKDYLQVLKELKSEGA